MIKHEDSVSGEAEILAVESSRGHHTISRHDIVLDSHPLIDHVRVDVPQHLVSDLEHKHNYVCFGFGYRL